MAKAKPPADSTGGFRIDLDDLTLGEVEEIEEMTGRPISGMSRTNASGRDLVALVFVVRRRDEPDLTLDQVRAMRISELQGTEITDRAPDPTEPAA